MNGLPVTVNLNLVPQVSGEVERTAVTGGENLPTEPLSETVVPVLLRLTLGHPVAQAEELLRHLDVLHGGEGVVPLPLQHYRHRV